MLSDTSISGHTKEKCSFKALIHSSFHSSTLQNGLRFSRERVITNTTVPSPPNLYCEVEIENELNKIQTPLLKTNLEDVSMILSISS